MPIYEYECLECGERFELRRSMSDSDQEVKCPRCGAENGRRVFSTFATTTSAGACAPSSPT
ncbi:MAG TPA: zinc ribbon domain-containing protein [Dehalococcoidia bacterium]|nr:zinc ribbon domain-containing protein [Dehalococcoidia bacterium]